MFWIWKNFFSINKKKKTLQGSWKAEILSLESVLKIKSVISLLPVFQDQLVFLEERESEVSGDTMCSSRSSTEGFSLLSFPCHLFPRTLEKFCLVHQAGFCCCYVWCVLVTLENSVLVLLSLQSFRQFQDNVGTILFSHTFPC